MFCFVVLLFAKYKMWLLVGVYIYVYRYIALFVSIFAHIFTNYDFATYLQTNFKRLKVLLNIAEMNIIIIFGLHSK